MFAKSSKCVAVLAVFALTLGAAATVQASVLYDYQGAADPMACAGSVSNSDLINGLAPSVFTGWQPNFGQSANLTNGTYGGNHVLSDISWAETNPVAEYDFASPKSIGQIRSFASWDDPNLIAQSYSVYVKHSGSTDFETTPIATASYNPGGLNQATMVTISDSTGTLVSDVVSVKFEITAGTGGAQPAFREIDVVASVPEPSTMTLLCAGVLGLLAYAWRKRR